jgi:glucose/arabinose dehydrogenase
MGLVVLTVDGTKVANEERVAIGRRVRDVIQAPDGALMVITDHKDGELMKVTPSR